MSKKYLGLIYALLAAMCNATIGIFSTKLLIDGMQPFAIAFYRCLIAFIILTIYLGFSGNLLIWMKYVKDNFFKLAACAFFGFFILHFFETNAYQYEKVPVVVFSLLGSATIITFVVTAIINKKMLAVNQIISCIAAVCGLGLLFDLGGTTNFSVTGSTFALIAGCGYGMFLTLSSLLRIGSGLSVVNSLIIFGTVYLFFPFWHYGGGLIHNYQQLWLLICLAFIPTIGGFWFTVRALTMIGSESVQLFELSEPLLSIGFAFVFLQQILSGIQLLGGLLILCAIFINMKFSKTP